MMLEKLATIAIIGGSGDLGRGLARLWANAGYRIVIGSRSKNKAELVAREISGNGRDVTVGDYQGAARIADFVVLAVPYASHDSIVLEIKDQIRGKILIDAVVPLVPPKVSLVQLPQHGSPALLAQKHLGPETKVVAAFHNVGAKKLHSGVKVDCDVLVFGDDGDAKDKVIALANKIASRGVDGGALANSIAAEALTSVLIAINRRYKIQGAGIHITGLPVI